MKDLETGTGHILCLDDKTLTLLKRLPGIVWSDRLGRSDTFTLRKQINAQIDEILSST